MRIQDCIHCGEPLEKGVPGTGVALHRECRFRLIAGGVNHQLGLCICCGGMMEPDPPHMTTREAAQAACDLWEKRRITQQAIFSDRRAILGNPGHE